MKAIVRIGAATLAFVPLQGALACPPPPPGWVPPTHEQSLERSLSGATDIVYGFITREAAEGLLPNTPGRAYTRVLCSLGVAGTW